MKRAGPYRSFTPASRWIPPPARKAMAPPLARAIPPEPAAAVSAREVAALARARACKVFDRNANGAADQGEPMVEGWRFRLAAPERGAKVRATGWDGCAEFTGLLPGSYFLSELQPPFWDGSALDVLAIDVPDRSSGGAEPAPALLTGGCVHFAHLGKAEYWAGPSGLRLLDDRDRRLVNALAPFRSPSTAFALGDEPFDGRLSDGVTPVRGAADGARAWGSGTWEAELAHFLGDRKVSADPRGRLAQEILVFTLNAEHFLEGARVVYVEDVPLFVDDLIFEGILAWSGDSPGWNHDMTALLAALNGSEGLPYVPRDACQVAYLPF